MAKLSSADMKKLTGSNSGSAGEALFVLMNSTLTSVGVSAGSYEDAIKEGDNVLIVDDLLATGGTSKAACDLVKKLGGNIIGLAFLIELSFLKGRDMLKDYDIFTLVDYDKEE